MKFPQPIPVKELARELNARLIGDESLLAYGINEIHKVQAGDITFSDVEKYFQKSIQSAATIILLNAEAPCPEGKAILVCENPFEAYDGLVKQYRPFRPLTVQISPEAKIDPTATIEPNVVIGPDVEIGKNCHIQANTTIYEHTIIGDNVIIEPNCVISSNAFYYKAYKDHRKKWRSGGRTIIENDVHIGAGSTIAKGVSGDTIIGKGTKIDCQVQIGHGAVIGTNCLITAQVGIAGKTIIGNDVIIYGQAGIAHGLHIGDKVVIGAKSGVSKDVKEGQFIFGYPAQDGKSFLKEMAALRQLPAFLKQFKKNKED
ncbi:MAG: UDP-3-O-(3-hydroxymyristoyl)glucosamine N-acyltransferase [Saprospiraceae bacterium]|nr:UDP-3-O-(3-hydroxymyristoyl)glucosamine N-acyltransferase [Saprospiraceae bacterium]